MSILNSPAIPVIGAALIAAGLAGLGAAALGWWHTRPTTPTKVDHEGATEAYADELHAHTAMTATTIDLPTITEVAADAAVIAEKQHRAEEAEEDRILAEVRAEIDAAFAAAGFNDKLITFRMRMGGLEARALRSAGVPRRRATWDEETSSWRRRDLKAAVMAA